MSLPVHDNKRNLAACLWHGTQIGTIDLLCSEALPNLLPEVVITDGPDKSSLDSQPGQGNQGCGDRASALNQQRVQLCFLVQLRIPTRQPEDVQGTLPEPDDFTL